MPILARNRAERLIQIARECFESDLTEAELKVLRESTSSLDPSEPEVKEPGPRISAEFIRWLATDARTLPYIDQRGIFVWGATVDDELDLFNCRVHSVLRLKSCTFHGELSLQSAETRALECTGSSFEKGINAGQILVHGSLWLDRIQASARVDLIGARIEGDLILSGASLLTSKVSNPHSNVYFEGVALSADRAVVSGAMFMHEGFKSSGEIRIVNAKIGSDLICDGAKLTSGSKALSMWRADIGGAVYFLDGFESSGEVNLSNARIAGMVSCCDASFALKNDVDGTAFSLNGAEIGDAVVLRNVECSGIVKMTDIRVQNDLEFREVKLSGSSDSIWLSDSEIKGNILFYEGFAAGTVNLNGTSISGDLRFIGATARHVLCTNVRLQGDLWWLATTAHGQLRLAGSSIRKLRDDRASWPAKGALNIDNFTYEDLILQRSPSASEIEKCAYSDDLEQDLARLEWLKLQPRDRQPQPQPWMHLAALLRAKGDEDGAKRIVFELRCVQAQTSSRAMRVWRVAFARLQQQPLWILVPVVITTLLATALFWFAGMKGAMAPTNKEIYAAWSTGSRIDHAYQRFDPLIYSLEMIFR